MVAKDWGLTPRKFFQLPEEEQASMIAFTLSFSEMQAYERDVAEKATAPPPSLRSVG